jgi:hypothetical protein
MFLGGPDPGRNRWPLLIISALIVIIIVAVVITASAGQ